MKIEIELDQETAACVWASNNWIPKGGGRVLSLSEAVEIVCRCEAVKFRKTHGRRAVGEAISGFNAFLE